MIRLIGSLACAAVLATLLGCGCGSCGSLDSTADAARHRERLLLPDEPDGAVGVIDLRESLGAEERPVIVVGQVGGMPEAVSREQATFAIMDSAAAAEHTHDECHDENCPFCAKGKANDQGLAVVHCVDGAGEVLSIPASTLLKLDETQTVVVRGRARIDDLGTLIVLADGVYIRQ